MELELGGRAHDLSDRALVVGVLNRTRDSFHDGGRYVRLPALLDRAATLVSDGADLLEVGARAGGVGTRDVSEDEELELVAETIAALRARHDVPLAVDTTRARVAAAAFSAGAVLGNDMSGFADAGYLAEAAAAGAAVVATHIRLPPGVPDPDPRYGDVVAEVLAALEALLERADEAGIPHRRTVVDPGLDLGKTWWQSLVLLAAMGRFAALGRPVLVAASHKLFLGRALGLAEDDRGDATLAACAIALGRGGRILRVHDVKPARRLADLYALVRAAEAGGTAPPDGGQPALPARGGARGA